MTDPDPDPHPTMKQLDKWASLELAAHPERGAKIEADRVKIAAWLEGQHAAGRPNYRRAAYAHLVYRIPWPRTDAAPEREYMRSWWEATRYIYSGLAPEDVRDEALTPA